MRYLALLVYYIKEHHTNYTSFINLNLFYNIEYILKPLNRAVAIKIPIGCISKSINDSLSSLDIIFLKFHLSYYLLICHKLPYLLDTVKNIPLLLATDIFYILLL